MKQLLLAFLVGVNALAAVAAEDASAGKQTEVLKLLHYTKQTGEFLEALKQTIAAMKKENPDYPLSYWDELIREVRTDPYSQWVAGLFEQRLTEAELKQLNAVFSNPGKKKLLDEMLVSLAGKNGADFVQAVQEFRKSHGAETADELIRFMQSPAARGYSAVLAQISAGQSKIMERLMREAHGRNEARKQRSR